MTQESQHKISFVTLGCAKNEVDTRKMRACVSAAGFDECADPAEADVVVVNTCSFITEATEESLAAILELLELPRVSQGTCKLVVAGCMPSRYGDELACGLPEVAAFINCADEDHVVTIIHELLGEAVPLDADGIRAVRTPFAPWAYVKIAEGCNRRCSFCTIPQIRGRYRSVPASEIIAEVDELVRSGAREVVLIAQDTGLWRDGGDRGDEGDQGDQGDQGDEGDQVDRGDQGDEGAVRDLPWLLDTLATRFPHTWLRVMYLQPQGITNKLLAVMARHANICNYLDIPLQHASERVLADMNRKGNGAHYLELLARIRNILPNVTLRTTVIAGFPGETRAEARELERFIEQAAFDYVGVFVYSQEDGTTAGERTDQVPLRTRKARAQRLRDRADAAGFAHVAARVGTTEQVLVLGADEDEQGDGYLVLGRTQRQAPEVDGMVHLDCGNIGEFVCATMVQAYCYELDGKVIDPHD